MSDHRNENMAFANDLDDLLRQLHDGAEETVQKAAANIETFDRVRWYLAAECSHATALGRLLKHRQDVMSGLVERLVPQQLAAPPLTSSPAPDVPDEQSSLSEILQRMRYEEAVQQRTTKPRPQPEREWWEDPDYRPANGTMGGPRR